MPILDSAEQGIFRSRPEDLIAFGFMSLQAYGILQPNKVLGEDLANFANKIRGAMMTDGNTHFRPTLRSTLTHLLVYSPTFGLDTRLIVQAAVKLVIPEVLAAIAHAQINKMAATEAGDNS